MPAQGQTKPELQTLQIRNFKGVNLTDQRQAIALAFFGAMTHQEIAEALQEPLGTVKARIRRGMLKLRDSLRAYL